MRLSAFQIGPAMRTREHEDGAGEKPARLHPRACIAAATAAQIVFMNKTLLLYGVLVFVGGLIGGALTNAVCRARVVTAAPASSTSAAAAPARPKTAAVAPRRIVTASEFGVLDGAGKPRAR